MCALPADSGHGILLDSLYDYLTFYGTAPNGVRYCYVQLSGLTVQDVAQEGVSEKDRELLLDWERNRLAGLGLTIYPF